MVGSKFTVKAMKSSRNKTIDFPLEQAKDYINKCIDGNKVDKIKENSTVIGDFFDTIKKVEDKSVDLLIVDPPYNLDKNFHGNGFKKLNLTDYTEYTEKWISALIPKLKDTASIYVCCDWESAMAIGLVLDKHFILRNRITWGRDKGRGAKSNWKNSMEDVYFATVDKNYTFNLDSVKQRKKVIAPYKVDGKPKDWQESVDGKFRYTCPSNFWDDIAIPYWSMSENTAHPTQKPEKLIAKLILASSNQGDVVLDPFAGSGTTQVVCKKLNRKYISIEQNPLYCAWAEKRLEMSEKDASIQGYEKGVFYERNSAPKRK